MKNFAKNKNKKTFGRREAVNAYNSASHFIGTHVNQSESLHSVSSVRLMTMNLFFFISARDFNSCCSPDCDWLLDYLEIDSTVVKCLDRK